MTAGLVLMKLYLPVLVLWDNLNHTTPRPTYEFELSLYRIVM